MVPINIYNINPGDYKRYQLSYAKWLRTGEIITESSKPQVVAINADEPVPSLDASISQFIENDTVVEYVVTAGTAGVKYDVTFSTTTGIGEDTQKVSHSIRFRVL